jgi:hypothetical protein
MWGHANRSYSTRLTVTWRIHQMAPPEVASQRFKLASRFWLVSKGAARLCTGAACAEAELGGMQDTTTRSPSPDYER